jgi:hypothetical protein
MKRLEEEQADMIEESLLEVSRLEITLRSSCRASQSLVNRYEQKCGSFAEELQRLTVMPHNQKLEHFSPANRMSKREDLKREDPAKVEGLKLPGRKMQQHNCDKDSDCEEEIAHLHGEDSAHRSAAPDHIFIRAHEQVKASQEEELVQERVTETMGANFARMSDKDAVKRVAELEQQTSSLTREVNKLRAQLSNALQVLPNVDGQSVSSHKQYSAELICIHAEQNASGLKQPRNESETDKAARKEREHQASHLAQELSAVRGSLDSAKPAGNAFADHHAALKQRDVEIACLSAQIKNLKKEIEEIGHAKVALDQERLIHSQTKHENAELKIQVTNLKKQIEEMKNEIATVEQLTCMLSQREDDFSVLAIESDRLRAELRDAKQEADIVQQERERAIVLEDEARHLAHEFETTKKELSHVIDRAMRAEASMADCQLWQEQAGQLSVQVQHLQIELDAVNKRVGVAEYDRASAKAWEDQVRALTTQLHRAHAEVVETKQISAAVQAAADENMLQKQILELKQQLEKEKSHAARLQTELQVNVTSISVSVLHFYLVCKQICKSDIEYAGSSDGVQRPCYSAAASRFVT